MARRSKPASSRPWRLLATAPTEQRGRNVPHACYASEYSAHNGALLRVRWGDFRTIQVHNVNTGREGGTYLLKSGGALSFSTPSDSTVARLKRMRSA